MKESGRNCEHVCAWFVSEFGKKVDPDVLIRDAVAARLDFSDLSTSLGTLCQKHEKADFNDHAKFGLLRKLAIEDIQLSEFLLIKGPKTFDELKGAIMQFIKNSEKFAHSKRYPKRYSYVGDRGCMGRHSVDPTGSRVEAIRVQDDLRITERHVENHVERSLEMITSKMENHPSVPKTDCGIGESPHLIDTGMASRHSQIEHQNISRVGLEDHEEQKSKPPAASKSQESSSDIENSSVAAEKVLLMKESENVFSNVSCGGHALVVEEARSATTVGTDFGRKPKFKERLECLHASTSGSMDHVKIMRGKALRETSFEMEDVGGEHEGSYGSYGSEFKKRNWRERCACRAKKYDKRDVNISNGPDRLKLRDKAAVKSNLKSLKGLVGKNHVFGSIKKTIKIINQVSSDIALHVGSFVRFRFGRETFAMACKLLLNFFPKFEDKGIIPCFNAIAFLDERVTRGITIGKDVPFDVGTRYRLRETEVSSDSRHFCPAGDTEEKYVCVPVALTHLIQIYVYCRESSHTDNLSIAFPHRLRNKKEN